ncbi:MAG: cobalamin-dependent protein [Oligoflexia bacterium]|nr:cobalamin-dependent protein [Oligoflexia bacterium]
MCYLGSHLLKDGHDVKIIDCETEAVRLDDLKEVLSSYKPDLVGIQVLSPLVDVVKQLCDEVKSISPSPIVLGGPHVSAVKEEVFAHIPNADYAIINEAEFTICQLVHALEKKIPFQEVANLYYKEEEKILFTKPLGFLENLLF